METLTGKEWLKRYSNKIKLLNYDGWPDYPGDFDYVPLTELEFLDRVASCTVQFLVNPSIVFGRAYDI